MYINATNAVVNKAFVGVACHNWKQWRQHLPATTDQTFFWVKLRNPFCVGLASTNWFKVSTRSSTV